MKLKITQLLLAALIVAAAPGCKKDDEPKTEDQPENEGEDPVASGPNTLVMRFSNICNGHDVDQVNGTMYSTGNGYNVSISKVKYYISNVVLIKDDGSEYIVPDMYHLVDEASIGTSGYMRMPNVPNGNYIGARFMVGVDSAKVASGSQSGDLDPAKGMFWSASQGYKSFVIEGTSNLGAVPSYTFNVGGYDALKTISVSFGGNFVTIDGVNKPLKPHLYADMLEVFKNPTAIDLTTTNNINSPGSGSLLIANNYADMFSFIHFDVN